MREQPNDYINAEKLRDFDYFFMREVILLKYAQGFIVMPGVWGALDELFEALMFMQTKKVRRFPRVSKEELRAKSYYLVKKTVLWRENYIKEEDWGVVNIVDTKDQAIKVIDSFYDKYRISPNF